MTQRLTDGSVNTRDSSMIRVARLAYRLGRLDQQGFVESACSKRLDDDALATLLHGLVADCPSEPVDFPSIVRGALFDSTAVNSNENQGWRDTLFNGLESPAVVLSRILAGLWDTARDDSRLDAWVVGIYWTAIAFCTNDDEVKECEAVDQRWCMLRRMGT